MQLEYPVGHQTEQVGLTRGAAMLLHTSELGVSTSHLVEAINDARVQHGALRIISHASRTVEALRRTRMGSSVTVGQLQSDVAGRRHFAQYSQEALATMGAKEVAYSHAHMASLGGRVLAIDGGIKNAKKARFWSCFSLRVLGFRCHVISRALTPCRSLA
jgi:hypothetical protein